MSLKSLSFNIKLQYWKDTLWVIIVTYNYLLIKPGPAIFSYKGDNFNFSLDKDLSSKLATISKR